MRCPNVNPSNTVAGDRTDEAAFDVGVDPKFVYVLPGPSS
jgi:hypothetical protein